MTNTIVLKGPGRHDERKSSGAITPGMLCKVNSSNLLIAHNVQGGPATPLVAIENYLCGKTIDDVYASGEIVLFRKLVPGDEVLMYLQLGENVAIDANLCSAGDGYLEAALAGDSIMFKAKEAVDASSVAKRIKCEVIAGSTFPDGT